MATRGDQCPTELSTTNRATSILIVLTFMLSVVLVIPQASAQNKVAFVTSVVGTGNLGNPNQWPDNDNLTGLHAADAICRNRAAAAGLSNPGDFVAWLSDSADDAYCRLHGLQGYKVTNCGQSSLPVAAGPWMRTDGEPFMDHIGLATGPNGHVYMPAALDEFGAEADIWTPYFTATNDQGGPALGENACSDWTSGTGSWVVIGHLQGTTSFWSKNGSGDCSDSRPLLCLEIGGPGSNLGAFAREGARVFVTSVAGSGNLGSWPEAGNKTGLNAGDAICQTLAGNAGLHAPESYVAWLSDSSSHAIDRLTGDGPWVRLDGVMVAANRSDLVDNYTILSSIHLTETGEYLRTFVFTGTYFDGLGSPNHCSGWTNGLSGDGETGDSPYSHMGWTQSAPRSCAEANRLYCFSNSNSWWIFEHGFENGTTSGWTVTVGD